MVRCFFILHKWENWSEPESRPWYASGVETSFTLELSKFIQRRKCENCKMLQVREI